MSPLLRQYSDLPNTCPLGWTKDWKYYSTLRYRQQSPARALFIVTHTHTHTQGGHWLHITNPFRQHIFQRQNPMGAGTSAFYNLWEVYKPPVPAKINVWKMKDFCRHNEPLFLLSKKRDQENLWNGKETQKALNPLTDQQLEGARKKLLKVDKSVNGWQSPWHSQCYKTAWGFCSMFVVVGIFFGWEYFWTINKGAAGYCRNCIGGQCK